MPIITLQIRMKVNSTSQLKNCTLLLQNVNDYMLNGMIYRIWATHPTLLWDELKQSCATQVLQANSEITSMLSFYLRNIKPKIQNLRNANQLEYSSYEVEISEITLNKPETLELAIYFYTKPYNLIQSFGDNLLLADSSPDIANTHNTFMIQLSDDLTIHTYTT
jgi:hypothetical protein